MPPAEQRFRAIRRRGGHDIWTGFTDKRGVGTVRIDGRLRTVQRAAWEFDHGPVPTGMRVMSCPKQRACVRVAHLSLAPIHHVRPQPSARRRPRGRGSAREVRPDVWEVVVTEGTTDAGTPRRRYLTVHGDSDDAHDALDELTARARRDLGDLRVRELVDRYLHALYKPRSYSFGLARRVLHEIIEPTFDDELAVRMTPDRLETLLTRLALRNAGRERL